MIQKDNLAFLILAAGSSSRLGQPKQLVAFNDQTLLQKVIRTALSFESIPATVVLGANAGIIKPSISNLPVQIVENKNWAEGMGSSVTCGINAILYQQPETEAVILLVCDQYRLNKSIIEKLIEKWKYTDKGIIASTYEQNFGVPALFSKKLFPELIALNGKRGAKKIIKAYLTQTAFVSFENGRYDLDTPEDLNTAINWLSIGNNNQL